MKQLLIYFCTTFLCFQLHAQIVSGDLFDEGRKIATPFSFELEELAEGEIYFELAVDRTGKVTGARYLSDRSVLISTPVEMRAKRYVMGISFEPGTHYPSFHHCIVRLQLKRKKAE